MLYNIYLLSTGDGIMELTLVDVQAGDVFQIAE